ncbi:hypothetical protein BLNAU_3226 [Blattamonas nauphoetae]|uniref:Uncharacterized protein n=1 Tax=Blattamonas nauphoetae TaxID=2049346 RepID=A0ABQ9YDX3_9EUKA|nr:hypothetical protein BLNAU_3226 [Blattamonas nauphoetae]
MFTSKEYSPFLQWNPDHTLSADSVAQPFVSLASMVRSGYEFDEELVSKVSQFLSSATSLIRKKDYFDGFFNAVGQDFPNPAAIQGYSDIPSQMSLLVFILKPPGHCLRKSLSQNPFDTKTS